MKEHKQLFYFNLLTSGKLNNYLADVNEQAKKLFFRLVKQLTENESITKQLKANNSIERITLMNNIRNKASETVNHDIIYI
ncbi:MAG: TnpV protein [Eubacterium sp.]|nr:TnpV protein [Eubacterium sp.]